QRDHVAVVAPLDRRRHHVELEHSIDLVGRKIPLVAFPEPVVPPGSDTPQSRAAGETPWLEVGPLNPQYARRNSCRALDFRGAEELLEVLVAPYPDLGTRTLARPRCGPIATVGGARSSLLVGGETRRSHDRNDREQGKPQNAVHT